MAAGLDIGQTLYDPLAAAELFCDEIAARSQEAEDARKYPQDLLNRMADAGLYRMCNPARLGGEECTARQFAEVIERVAKADASAAWVLFIGVSSMVAFAGFDEPVAKELLNAPDTKAAGVFAPRGRAIPATHDNEAGYLLSGRWPWGSGTQNCDWLGAGAFVLDESGEIVRHADGTPDQRMFAVRREQVTFLDTWDVSGLRGTGSTDFEIQNVFVPARYGFDLARRETPPETIFSFSTFGFLAIGIASVALGTARAAIDELVSFASAKTPQGGRRKLAEKSSTQRAVAEAEAMVRSARLFFYQAIDKAWAEAEEIGTTSEPLKRDLRLAMTHATTACAEAVRKMYDIGGGTSVYRTSPLQRHFRDIHVATQHVMVGKDIFDLTGRLFLGVETDTAML